MQETCGKCGLGPDLNNTRITIVGDQLGSKHGPFDRILKRVGLDWDSIRLFDTSVHCSWHKESILSESHDVVVGIGAPVSKNLLGNPVDKFKMNDWHGSPVLEPGRRFYVVPTFQPWRVRLNGAFVPKDLLKLTGVTSFDLQQAIEVSTGRFKKTPTSLIVDPPPDWFGRWALKYEEALSSGQDIWLAVDIETKGKGTVEDEIDDTAYDITRINFAFNPDEGVTVPFLAPWLDGIRALLESTGTKILWHARYDIEGLRRAGISVSGRLYDFMWAAHMLQSDLPRGLGFWAPLYSTYGPWKHINHTNPGLYAAIDPVQTLRCAFGIARDLQANGQWEIFLRHVYEMDTIVLHPAEKVGLLVDRDKLEKFKIKLEGIEVERLAQIQACVPEEVLDLHPPLGWKKPPKEDFIISYKRGENKLDIQYLLADVVSIPGEELVKQCQTCLVAGVSLKHRCKDEKGKINKTLIPKVVEIIADVTRYFCKEPFNPSSPSQVLSYIVHKGRTGGKAKDSKTDTPSTDKKALEALAKATKDPFYRYLLDYRVVSKVKGTYVEGSQRRMDSEGRLHCEFTHAPSTMRLSCRNPNLHNIVADRGGKESIAAGFRDCIIAAPECVLIEADYSALEAVLTGWFAGDPQYIRIAKLGIHAHLASHLLGKSGSLSWPDAELGRYLKKIKADHPEVYLKAKTGVHAISYGQTPIGTYNTYPELYGSRAEAEKVHNTFYSIAPKVKAFQDSVRLIASKHGYLGGSIHPFKYRHWFWDVFTWNSKYNKWSMGSDSKRVVANLPQSTGSGIVTEAMLRLMEPGSNYIGNMYFGKTPIRAQIHDSILGEFELRHKNEAIRRMVAEMTRPIIQMPCPPEWNMGEYLSIGVAVKVGFDWGNMEEVNLEELGVASDTSVIEEEEEIT